MTTLGTELLEGSVRLWAASADQLTDAAVFLVHRVRQVPARICSAADLVNYPDEVIAHLGWYRAAGVQYDIDNTQDLRELAQTAKEALVRLDDELALSPDATTASYALGLYRTGDAFGQLVVERRTYGANVRLDLSVTHTLPNWEPFFLVDDYGGFAELVGVRQPWDDQGSGSDGGSGSGDEAVRTAVRELTLWVPQALEAGLIAALAADLCDSATATEVLAGSIDPGG